MFPKLSIFVYALFVVVVIFVFVCLFVVVCCCSKVLHLPTPRCFPFADLPPLGPGAGGVSGVEHGHVRRFRRGRFFLFSLDAFLFFLGWGGAFFFFLGGGPSKKNVLLDLFFADPVLWLAFLVVVGWMIVFLSKALAFWPGHHFEEGGGPRHWNTQLQLLRRCLCLYPS